MPAASAAVCGPVSSAQRVIRPGVHSRWRRWDAGMCSVTVVKPPRRKLRGWLATRRPRTNTSTVDAVSLVSYS